MARSGSSTRIGGFCGLAASSYRNRAGSRKPPFQIPASGPLPCWVAPVCEHWGWLLATPPPPPFLGSGRVEPSFLEVAAALPCVPRGGRADVDHHDRTGACYYSLWATGVTYSTLRSRSVFATLRSMKVRVSDGDRRYRCG